MSFIFNQDTLNGMEEDNSQPFQDSAYFSQDAGYNDFVLPRQMMGPSISRRSFTRPPTWSNLPQELGGVGEQRTGRMTGGGKIIPGQRNGGRNWTFNSNRGKRETGNPSSGAARERDLFVHLGEVSEKIQKLPGKVSKLVEESVNYMESCHSKSNQGAVDKLSEVKISLTGLSTSKRVQLVDLKERVSVLEQNVNDLDQAQQQHTKVQFSSLGIIKLELLEHKDIIEGIEASVKVITNNIECLKYRKNTKHVNVAKLPLPSLIYNNDNLLFSSTRRTPRIGSHLRRQVSTLPSVRRLNCPQKVPDFGCRNDGPSYLDAGIPHYGTSEDSEGEVLDFDSLSLYPSRPPPLKIRGSTEYNRLI